MLKIFLRLPSVEVLVFTFLFALSVVDLSIAEEFSAATANSDALPAASKSDSANVPGADSEQVDPSERVRQAIEYWRGQSSEMVSKMFVHREDWQRESELRTWTKGTSRSLVRFIAPKKDAGNASLTVENDMWTFSPKTRRAIKVPPSMKSQSWMGSDFSYQDLSKDDEIVDEYTHRLIATELVAATETSPEQTVYVIEAQPKEDAPVVWGKEVLKIRDDNIIIEHTFYDQEGIALKQLRAVEIGVLGDRLYPKVSRMTNLEDPTEWTEVRHVEAKFNIDLNDSFFVVGNLSRR